MHQNDYTLHWYIWNSWQNMMKQLSLLSNIRKINWIRRTKQPTSLKCFDIRRMGNTFWKIVANITGRKCRIRYKWRHISVEHQIQVYAKSHKGRFVAYICGIFVLQPNKYRLFHCHHLKLESDLNERFDWSTTINYLYRRFLAVLDAIL